MKFNLVLIANLIFFIPVLSQNVADITNPAAEHLTGSPGLFSKSEPLEITLKFDITEFKRKRDDSTYMEALLSTTSNGDTMTRRIKLRARGEFRRKFCDMPPIMLNFDINDSIKGDFGNINKLKMVAVCQAGNEEDLLKEYLTYKLYSVLTDISYRVRLLKVKYENTRNDDRVLTEFAFVIEPDEFLAKRIESVEVKTKNLTQKNVKPEMMDRTAIFNYMIGNSDWSVPIGHNIKLYAQYRSERPDLAAIVPFDFDFSGIVNTDYAAPFHTLNINSVRERIYLGVCRDKKTYLAALDEFILHEKDFVGVISNCTWLSERSKEDMVYYLRSFFEELANPDALARTILRECIRF